MHRFLSVFYFEKLRPSLLQQDFAMRPKELEVGVDHPGPSHAAWLHPCQSFPRRVRLLVCVCVFVVLSQSSPLLTLVRLIGAYTK